MQMKRLARDSRQHVSPKRVHFNFAPFSSVHSAVGRPKMSHGINLSTRGGSFPMRHKYSNPSHQVKPVQMRGSKYSIPRTIIPPDLGSVLDVITQGTATINSEVFRITQEGDAAIDVATNNTTNSIKSAVQAEVTSVNTTLNTELTNIFNTNKVLIENAVATLTASENAESAQMIDAQKTVLLNAIYPLITNAEATITALTNTASSDELNNLITLITTENQNVYNQVAAIVNDPNNTNPILPQIVFPDVNAIANSITPGKTELKAEILLILQTLYNDIVTEVQSVTNTKLTEQTSILQTYSAQLVTQLESARNTVLSETSTLIDQTTTTEIGNITTILQTNNATLQTEYTTIIDTFNNEIETAINAVTQTEINNILPVIRQYNREVAAQIVLPTF
ncbi:hypothetical protein M153_4870001244 [Pseudoloma neurophilia]|uniref:Uncharacterized protein n=1 Tax=Pseudoloma neurophilia TaxID=146866 RepID=A0A0R0LX75_9MICR|nr:hypothetical protein M153_4870001244 [Pseudoloma neurophilia]